MANLISALKSEAKDQRHEMSTISAITEVQRLIADKGAEDLQILQEMGMANSVMKAMDMHGRKLELEALEKMHGQVFSIAEIKAVACKYALKFRRSDTYNGVVDPVMIQKLRQFFADSGVEMNAAKLGYNCFILAPPQAFKLEERPRPAPKDPILFYKLDENNYKLIHKWGADLTPLRRLVGMKYKSHLTYFLYYWLVLSIPAMINIKIFGWSHGDFSVVMNIVLLVAAFVLAVARLAGDDWGGEYRSWKEIWNDGFKPKK